MFPSLNEIGFFETLFYQKNMFPNHRFGQAFCNWFMITDAEIFYEEDEQKVRDLVWKRATN